MNDGTQSKLFAVARSLTGVGPQSHRDTFLLMTENRDDWTPQSVCPGPVRANGKCAYEWCGDYVTYVLFVSGVVDGKMLNRQAINGKWFPGQNLTMIEKWSRDNGVWRQNIDGCDKPAVYIQKRGAGDHIGFIEGRNGSDFLTLDGNSVGNVVASRVKQLKNDGCRGYVLLDDIPVQAEAAVPQLSIPGTPSTPWFPGAGIPNTLPFPFPTPSGSVPGAFNPIELFRSVVGQVPVFIPTDGAAEEALVAAMAQMGTLIDALTGGTNGH